MTREAPFTGPLQRKWDVIDLAAVDALSSGREGDSVAAAVVVVDDTNSTMENPEDVSAGVKVSSLTASLRQVSPDAKRGVACRQGYPVIP